MLAQPNLSEQEWELIVQLLQQEQAELPVEIHHSRNQEFRDELRQRLNLVRHLLDRLQMETAT